MFENNEKWIGMCWKYMRKCLLLYLLVEVQCFQMNLDLLMNDYFINYGVGN